jgi:transposase
VAARGKVPSFVPVRIVEQSVGGTTGEPDGAAPAQTRLPERAAPAKSCGMIEIEVSGARVRVEPGVELMTLSTVLSALRGGR